MQSFSPSHKGLFYLFIGLLPSFLLVSCREKESPVSPRPYSRIITLPVTETVAGATFSAEITHYGPSRITEHGFEWWSTDNDPPKVYQHSLGPRERAGYVSALVTGSLEPTRYYYMRTYLKDGKYIVYGNVVRFTSKGSPAPVIEAILPTRVTFGDTITIQGQHFNRHFSENMVWLNSQAAKVVSAAETEIRAIVPVTLTGPTVKLNLKTGERYLSRENAFELVSR